MVATNSSDSLGGAVTKHGLGSNLIAALAERALLLEEHLGPCITHLQRDELLAFEALDVELDHRAALHSRSMTRVVLHERCRGPISPAAVIVLSRNWRATRAMAKVRGTNAREIAPLPRAKTC